MAKKSGLGDFGGLEALFDDNSTDIQVKKQVRLSDIEPNRNQPRKEFDEDTIRELAESIEEHGLIQPILVRPLDNGMYQIVAGERRWRALRMLGWQDKEIPVVIKELDDEETAKIALVENVLREDLNPIDEAKAYNELIEKYDMTQESVAKLVGKARSSVTNSLRILKLPENVVTMVRDGDLSAGAAKALLPLTDEEQISELALKSSKGEMTVRQLEKAVAKLSEPQKEVKEEKPKKNQTYYKEMEIALSQSLERKVKVTYGKGKGKLVIDFFDKDDLKTIAEMLTKE
ncbi:MAG: ParB/RepB/Spo0J family partition protein [Oscillospiraceae bacterium]|nr:ParB/RepB/Spo0J family partition protein [Oscillospiraceae bacterium]